MEDLQYVGFWARFRATIVDTILLILIIYPIFYLLYGDAFMEKGAEFNAVNNFINYILPFIGVLILWHYKSATPGKMLIKASIVDATTYAKPSTKQFVIRYLGYLISLLPLGLGYFWAGWDKKKQTWHDKLAHTVVVQPKIEKKRVGFFTYVLRGFGILFIGLMIPLLIVGLMLQGGYMPDGDIYTKERLKSSVIEELKKKNILNDSDKLVYFQPDNMFSFTDSGTVITTEGINVFYTSEDTEILSNNVLFSEIPELKIVLSDDIMGIEMVEIYMLDNSEEYLLAIVTTQTGTKDSFKKEITKLWNSARAKTSI